MSVAVLDTLIVGGGPAGLAAALCLGRARRSVMVIDNSAPRHAVAEGVHNFLSRDGIPPATLRTVAWEQMRPHTTVSRREGTVASLARATSGEWVGTLEDGESFTARTALLATGVIDQHPDIRGYDALWGRSIFHCPYCHGWEVRDQPLAVLGHGAQLAQFAPLLTSWSRDIVACTNGTPLDDDVRRVLVSYGVAVRTEPVAELEAKDGALDAIRFEDGTRIGRHALFVMAAPRLPAVVGRLDLDVDDSGYLRVDDDGLTSIPALWAAGDVTSRRHQVIEAAAQGLRSAMAINRALVFGPPRQ